MSRYYAQPYDDGDVMETLSNRPITRRYSTDEQIQASRQRHVRRTTSQEFEPVVDAYYEMESAGQRVSHTAPTQKIVQRGDATEDWTRRYDSQPPVRQTRTGGPPRRPLQPVRQPQPQRRQEPQRRPTEPRRRYQDDYGDDEVNTGPVMTRRSLWRRGLPWGIATVVGGGLVGEIGVATRSWLVNVIEQWNAGDDANSLALVCGHNHDDASRPTRLKAIIWDGELLLMEAPAGDLSKLHVQGPLAAVPQGVEELPIQITKKKTASGKYMIHLHGEYGPVDWAGNRSHFDVDLYDISGYFQPKGGK